MARQDLGVRRQHTSDNSFLIEVVNGLSQPQKSLPSRFFYDAAGSELFEKITGPFSAGCRTQPSNLSVR